MQLRFFSLLSLLMLIIACGDDDDITTPKPKGYFRINFPEKLYQKYDSACPYSFNYPAYATVGPDEFAKNEPCWLNINFNRFKATLHLSYKAIKNDSSLYGYIDDCYTFITKHYAKASALNERVVKIDSTRVYGIVYDIEGNAASNLQFYLTDSTNHFVRGALYFNVAPNKDSINPVLNFIAADVGMFINSFRWKGTEIKQTKKSKIIREYPGKPINKHSKDKG